MSHAQTYQMKWPDQLSHIKEKAQHNKVSQVKRKKACKKKKSCATVSESIQCHQGRHYSEMVRVSTKTTKYQFSFLT